MKKKQKGNGFILPKILSGFKTTERLEWKLTPPVIVNPGGDCQVIKNVIIERRNTHENRSDAGYSSFIQIP